MTAPTDAERAREIVEARFFSFVSKSDGCWLWTGAIRRGYGGFHMMRYGRHSLMAHRVSWELHFGPIPDGMYVCHRCDVRNCVRPDHLFIGSQSDNMRDCAAKRRNCIIGKSRMMSCKRGHEFSDGNVYRDGRGHRRCVTCARTYRRERTIADAIRRREG